VRLKLDGIGAHFARKIDEGVRKAERSVMGLRHLGDEEGRRVIAHGPVTNADA
jgi:hypothetical protein